MARGGKRPGAGRKQGQVSKETEARKAIALKAIEGGISPLDVMLGAMREAWDHGNKKDAASFAEKAAPYVHPRLAAVELSGNDDKPLKHEISNTDAHAFSSRIASLNARETAGDGASGSEH